MLPVTMFICAIEKYLLMSGCFSFHFCQITMDWRWIIGLVIFFFFFNQELLLFVLSSVVSPSCRISGFPLLLVFVIDEGCIDAFFFSCFFMNNCCFNFRCWALESVVGIRFLFPALEVGLEGQITGYDCLQGFLFLAWCLGNGLLLNHVSLGSVGWITPIRTLLFRIACSWAFDLSI